MPSDIERGVGQKQAEDQFETEFGKIGQELPIEVRDSERGERDMVREAEKYYTWDYSKWWSLERYPVLSRRSGNDSSSVLEKEKDNVIRQHHASEDSLWIGVYNENNQDLELDNFDVLNAIIVRLLIEKDPEYRANDDQIKRIRKKLPNLSKVVYDDKKINKKVLIGKKILRDCVEDAIFQETGLEEFGKDRKMKALTVFVLFGKRKQREQDL